MSSKTSKDGSASGVLNRESMTFGHACYGLQGRDVRLFLGYRSRENIFPKTLFPGAYRPQKPKTASLPNILSRNCPRLAPSNMVGAVKSETVSRIGAA